LISKKFQITENGQNKLVGKCVKHTFVSKNGTIKEKIPAKEAIITREGEGDVKKERNVLKLAKKILNNPNP